jgi:hypothetical protein
MLSSVAGSTKSRDGWVHRAGIGTKDVDRANPSDIPLNRRNALGSGRLLNIISLKRDVHATIKRLNVRRRSDRPLEKHPAALSFRRIEVHGDRVKQCRGSSASILQPAEIALLILSARKVMMCSCP